MRRALLLAVTALLVLPATALGATRYASPAGVASGSCAEATPCSLAFAVTAATAGDEVVVTSGTYPVAATIEATVALTIRGVGASRPRVVGAKGVTPLKSGVLLLLSNLAIESNESTTGTLFAYADGDVFDHLELIATGSNALALRPGVNWTLTDSLLVAKGEGAIGVFVQGTAAGTATMRSDTAVAEGKASIGVAITGVAPAVDKTIVATDVISIGELAAEAKDNKGAISSIAFDHSDLRGMVVGAVTSTAAVTAAPKFVDAAAGNYREAAGSPTIDAGVNDPANGATDLDGHFRSLPGHLTCGPEPPAITDIGAFEFVPSAPPCLPPGPTTTGPKKSGSKKSGPPQTVLGKATIKGQGAKLRFGATGERATSFECKLDGKRWRTCTSPVTYERLRPGRHAFRVRAVGAGGADATPALRKFRIHRPHVHHHGVS